METISLLATFDTLSLGIAHVAAAAGKRRID